MNKTNININLQGLGCLTAILFSWWTDRTLDFWCSYYTGHEVNIPFFFSFLLNLFCGLFATLGNIVSEIIRVCIGA